MPNQYQLAFLVSFATVFASLFFLSNLVKSALREAGYDISELILYGLPKRDGDTLPPRSTVFETRTAMFAQLLAVVLAACTSAVLYWKYAASKREYTQHCLLRTRCHAHPTFSAARKPVLDSSKWQQFPLQEKIVISHNTAL